MAQIQNNVLKNAFQKKKKMMEGRTPRGSGSQRLFQQVPYQFCNVVCRVGFHRLYTTPYGRYWSHHQGSSSGLPAWAGQADISVWLWGGILCHWPSEVKSFGNGWYFILCWWVILNASVNSRICGSGLISFLSVFWLQRAPWSVTALPFSSQHNYQNQPHSLVWSIFTYI